MSLKTPYYLIDESKLQQNLQVIDFLRKNSGVKVVLALKCFATWATFQQMQPFLDGTTSSSLYEAKLGYEEFGKEVHAYSSAFSSEDILELKGFADKVIFNSVSQLRRFHTQLPQTSLGLRVNPQISYSHYDLADPARLYSRLGVVDEQQIESVLHLLQGVMLHYNCENDDYDNFAEVLDKIVQRYEHLLLKLDWLSLGGGISFTTPDYPIQKLSDKLRELSERLGVQIYLEPGDAVVTKTTNLVVEVMDIVRNQIDIAIVNTSVQAHMPDLLIYQDSATIDAPPSGEHRYMLAGQSCLAGDILGTFGFERPLQIGDKIYIANAGGYTMVENNWFNGLRKPAIAIQKMNGEQQLVKEFSYSDYKNSLS